MSEEKIRYTNPDSPIHYVHDNGSRGLTKREYFACQIYAAISTTQDNIKYRKMSASVAVECAHALIEELNKDQES